MTSLHKQLEYEIMNMPSGSVLSVADFYRMASPKTVSKMLTRLEGKGVIEKVLRSIFWKPDGVNTSPAPHAVAEAIARQNNWHLAPSGETALHLFGLSRHKPHVWTYVTNGTYRTYSYDGKEISFTHTSWKFLGKMSERTKLLVQCLKAYGREYVTEELLVKLAEKIGEHEWKSMLHETAGITDWISKAVLRMFGKRVANRTEYTLEER